MRLIYLSGLCLCVSACGDQGDHLTQESPLGSQKADLVAGDSYVKVLTQDAGIHMELVPDAWNTVKIAAGIGGPLVLAGGQVGLAENGIRYVLATRDGESVIRVLAALRSFMESEGVTVQEFELPTIDTLQRCWVISLNKERP